MGVMGISDVCSAETLLVATIHSLLALYYHITDGPSAIHDLFLILTLAAAYLFFTALTIC